MKTTLTVKGIEYTFEEITIAAGDELEGIPRQQATLSFVALCLKAGGHSDATLEWVKNTFPRWINGVPAISVLASKAYEANGVKFDIPAVGEGQPAGPALVTESA